MKDIWSVLITVSSDNEMAMVADGICVYSNKTRVKSQWLSSGVVVLLP